MAYLPIHKLALPTLDTWICLNYGWTGHVVCARLYPLDPSRVFILVLTATIDGPRLGLYLGFINPLPGLLAIWLGIRSALTLWFSCHLFGMYATPPAPFFCCRLFSGAAPLLSITGCLRFLDERHRFGKVSPRISARS